MKNKLLNIIIILFQCIGIGAIFLYIYNTIFLSGKYETIPTELNATMQIYLIIGLVAFFLTFIFIMLKKLIMNPEIIGDNMKNKEISEDQKLCPSCKKPIDKDAYICVHCGNVVINENDEPKEEKETINSEVDYDLINKYYNDDEEIITSEPINVKQNIFPKIFLIIFILASIFIIYEIAINKSIFNKDEVVVIDDKVNFLNIAKNIVTEEKWKDIELNSDKVYFTLFDLGYISDNYDSKNSYLAIDSNNNDIYISLVGTSKYKEFSINITKTDELDITKVLENTSVISDLNGKLLIDNLDKVDIYIKN